jgi:hypothetical protein
MIKNELANRLTLLYVIYEVEAKVKELGEW